MESLSLVASGPCAATTSFVLLFRLACSSSLVGVLDVFFFFSYQVIVIFQVNLVKFLAVPSTLDMTNLSYVFLAIVILTV